MELAGCRFQPNTGESEKLPVSKITKSILNFAFRYNDLKKFQLQFLSDKKISQKQRKHQIRQYFELNFSLKAPIYELMGMENCGAEYELLVVFQP